MALRRERILVEVVQTQHALLGRMIEGEAISWDELEGYALRTDVAVTDEMEAQARVRFWQRIPDIGKPWPDRMLGEALGQLSLDDEE